MASNAIDILIRAQVDQAIRGINKLSGVIKGVLAGAALKTLIDNIAEAQDATAQLDRAFESTGKTVLLTRQRLDDLSSELQQTTKFSDDLVKQAESVLLTFNRVRGEGFERTIKAAGDLSARFGIDLVAATKLLGKALQDPTQGLTALRRAGVTFTDQQKDVISSLSESGERAKAQSIILGELEKRFGGAAEAARNTLGGALEGLKNSFGDIFESTEKGTEGAVQGINSLAKSFNDPKLKEGIDILIAGLAKLIELLAKLAASSVKAFSVFGQAVGDTAAKLAGFKTDNENLNKLIKEREELIRLRNQGRNDTTFEALMSGKFEQKSRIDEDLNGVAEKDQKAFFDNRIRLIEAQIERERQVFRKSTAEASPTASVATGNIGEDPEDAAARQAASLKEVTISELRKTKNAYDELLDDLDSKTKTSQEKQIEAFEETRQELKLLRDERKITQEQFEKRLDEAQDKLLPEIDLKEIRSMYKKVEQIATESAGIIKGAYEQAGASIQASLSNAIQGGKFSLRSLVDVARKAFADIAAALLVSGIKKAIASALSGGSGGSGGGGGTGTKGAILGAIGSFFGFKASGGFASTPQVVGEEGPEVIKPVAGGVQVFNKRQLQSSGIGGTNVSFSPSTSITVIERNNEGQTRQEVIRFVQTENAKNNEKLVKMLAKNGVTIR
jgi:hypothetical protein